MLQVSLLVIVANLILNTAGASASYSTRSKRKYFTGRTNSGFLSFNAKTGQVMSLTDQVNLSGKMSALGAPESSFNKYSQSGYSPRPSHGQRPQIRESV
jgi:hypothetical protein